MNARQVQRAEALARANEYRFRRAELKRDIKNGTIRVGDVLAEPSLPAWLKGMKAVELLAVVRYCSLRKACGLMVELRIPEMKTLGEMTYRQRRVIASRIARLDSKMSERRAVSHVYGAAARGRNKQSIPKGRKVA